MKGAVMRFPNVLWSFVCLFILMTLAVMIPAYRKVKTISNRVLCESHLKGLTYAVKIYAYENDDQYPTPEKWCDLILDSPGGFNEKAFWCRAEPKGTFSYAINNNIYGTEPNNIPPKTVLLFEADLGRNAIGGSADLVLRHEKMDQLGSNVSFVDGHVEFVEAKDIFKLHWTVEDTE